MRYVDDFVDDKGCHVLVTEDCQGGDLKRFIQEEGGKPENLDLYLSLFSGIISGLAEIHSRSHLHRDVKPANVFVAFVK